MGFKLPDHKDRQGDAIKARTAALEKFKAKAAAIDPAAVAERAAAKAATEARRMAAAAITTVELREAERKRVRDERYAARKAAKKR
jgi:hypothetical protein